MARFGCRCILIALAGVGLLQAASAQSLWKRFVPVQQIEASPTADYALSESNGPWHVMAATFSGEGAEDQARELALEFRSKYNVPAYVHQMTFDLGDERVGRGIDERGAPVRYRYQKGDRVREVAVVLGDFPTIDDPRAEELLERVKTLKPDALSTADGRETTQTLVHLRRLQKATIERIARDNVSGPMRSAFICRNPILPKEYFVPRGVDNFVANMNKGVEHSLLDCPNRYTIQVAHFEGKVVIEGAASTGRTKRSKKQVDDPLVVAAENAHGLTVALRAKGWDAYEFHDREQSLVTVGSFDEVDVLPGAERLIPRRDQERIVIQTFGAAFNSPANPVIGEPTSIIDRNRAQEVTQRFNQVFSSEHGQIAHGLKPKYLEVLPGRFITFEVHPHVIEVPRRSVSSTYAWQ
ncbi:MAG: hypothetical protein WD851_10510 [Pirellulales bacterium]